MRSLWYTLTLARTALRWSGSNVYTLAVSHSPPATDATRPASRTPQSPANRDLGMRATLLFLSVVLAWEARGHAPTLPLLAGVVIVHLPILHVTGPHYYYWPVAWWSMYAAAVVVAVVTASSTAVARARGAAAPALTDDEPANAGDD